MKVSNEVIPLPIKPRVIRRRYYGSLKLPPLVRGRAKLLKKIAPFAYRGVKSMRRDYVAERCIGGVDYRLSP